MRKSLERELSNVDLTIPVRPDPPSSDYDSKVSKKTDSKKNKNTKVKKDTK